jgi:hypothetical protein
VLGADLRRGGDDPASGAARRHGVRGINPNILLPGLDRALALVDDGCMDTDEERRRARRARLAEPAYYPDEIITDDGKMKLPKEVYKAIDGPMSMAFSMAGKGMAPSKAVEDCDANEIRLRAIWHALHYVQRRLSGWDALPTDFFEDRINWERQTEKFEQMAKERERGSDD